MAKNKSDTEPKYTSGSAGDPRVGSRSTLIWMLKKPGSYLYLGPKGGPRVCDGEWNSWTPVRVSMLRDLIVRQLVIPTVLPARPLIDAWVLTEAGRAAVI